MGFLTTHVLDTANGCPAANVRIELYKIVDKKTEYICDAITNGDGRCDAEILKGSEFIVGTYELHFHVGNYFKSMNLDVKDHSFLDRVPIRFNISSAEEHYHVPLLVSPFSYTTYRGS